MNATKTIVRFYQTVQPHRPSIKFRYGIPENNKTDLTSSSAVTGAVHIVEATQLPPKFHRSPMDEAEISAINSGGAE